MAKNKVIAGDYVGQYVGNTLGTVTVGPMVFEKWTVAAYEVVTEEMRKSAVSGIARGLIGGAIFGSVGMIAGGLSARNTGTYTVAIQWKNHQKSLVEVDDRIYKAMVKAMF